MRDRWLSVRRLDGLSLAARGAIGDSVAMMMRLHVPARSVAARPKKLAFSLELMSGAPLKTKRI